MNCSCQAHRSEQGVGGFVIHHIFLFQPESYEAPDVLNQIEPSWSWTEWESEEIIQSRGFQFHTRDIDSGRFYFVYKYNCIDFHKTGELENTACMLFKVHCAVLRIGDFKELGWKHGGEQLFRGNKGQYAFIYAHKSTGALVGWRWDYGSCFYKCTSCNTLLLGDPQVMLKQHSSCSGLPIPSTIWQHTYALGEHNTMLGNELPPLKSIAPS